VGAGNPMMYTDSYITHRQSSLRVRYHQFNSNTCLENWRRFQGHLEDSYFKKSLSSAQRSSLQVLNEWWHTKDSCIQPLVHAAEAWMVTQSKLPSVDDPTATEELLKIADTIGTNSSLYHAACYNLFCYELHPATCEPHLNFILQYVQNTRQLAVQHAVCHRLSSALNYHLEPVQFMDQITSFPRPGRNDNGWYEAKYYLYDTWDQRTIEVNTLSECPPYRCISHTWGRWRKTTSSAVSGESLTIFLLPVFFYFLIKLNSCS
jgi:hypothetical protein